MWEGGKCVKGYAFVQTNFGPRCPQPALARPPPRPAILQSLPPPPHAELPLAVERLPSVAQPPPVIADETLTQPSLLRGRPSQGAERQSEPIIIDVPHGAAKEKQLRAPSQPQLRAQPALDDTPPLAPTPPVVSPRMRRRPATSPDEDPRRPMTPAELYSRLAHDYPVLMNASASAGKVLGGLHLDVVVHNTTAELRERLPQWRDRMRGEYRRARDELTKKLSPWVNRAANQTHGWVHQKVLSRKLPSGAATRLGAKVTTVGDLPSAAREFLTRQPGPVRSAVYFLLALGVACVLWCLYRCLAFALCCGARSSNGRAGGGYYHSYDPLSRDAELSGLSIKDGDASDRSRDEEEGLSDGAPRRSSARQA